MDIIKDIEYYYCMYCQKFHYSLYTTSIGLKTQLIFKHHKKYDMEIIGENGNITIDFTEEKN